MHMARRTTRARSGSGLEGSTEFQVYVPLPANVVDITARRLVIRASGAGDPTLRATLAALACDYLAGHVAVAWKRGWPIHVRLDRSA